ncbi:MAG: ribosome-recycling factor [bacterium]|nr:ribosome-recycling factor [bacterium]
MNDILQEYKANIQARIDKLKEEFKSIRTGRAQGSMVENIVVETYGGSMKMKILELASITTEGSSTIIITAFDPSTVQDIEKAILTSPIGLTPKTEGNVLIIRIPAMNEEQRIKYTKVLSQQVEETKQSIRYARDDIRKKVKVMMDEKDITKDENFRLEKEIDNLTRLSSNELQELKDRKEEEIMAI